MKVVLFLCFSISFLPLLAQESNWDSLNSKSVTYYKSGEYTQSLQLADQAIAIAEENYGIYSTQFITSLENKSHALAATGSYLEAIKLSQQAVKLSYALYDKPHLLQIESLHGLVKGHLNLGHYDSAEYLLNQANHIFSRIQEENKAHYDSAIWSILNIHPKLNALRAILYHRKGQLYQAIKTLENQLVWMEEVYPEYEKLEDYQTTLNNLGTYYNETLQLEKSKVFALRYLTLLNKYDGKPINKVNAFQNLASLYRSLENYDSAFYYLQTAISDVEEQGMEQSKLYVILLNNLGTLYLDIDQTESALKFLIQAKELQDNETALNSRVYKNTLHSLAEAYRWSGKYEQADQLYTQLIALIIADVNHNFTYLSDAEKLSFYKSQLQYINDYKSFALEVSGLLPLQDSNDPYINPEIAGRLYNLQLSTKAIILNASKRMRSNILDSEDTALISAFMHWEWAKNQLANQLNNQNIDFQSTDSLQRTVEFYEKWLIANSAKFRTGFQQEEITWKDIQSTLKEGEVAVELVRLVDGLAYAALIVTPKTEDQPIISLVLGRNMQYLEKEFYSNYRNSITYRLRDTLSYNVFWEPISKVIKANLDQNPDRVYVSNDGIYNQINLNTLYNPATGEYLLDETDIHLLTNTKELLSPENSDKNNRTAILLGDPDFDIHRAKGYSFTPLPGAGEEVNAIDQIMKVANWQTKTFTGDEASEYKLNSLTQPGVLHIASHGYFTPNESQTTNNINQMLNSGIVLASDGIEEDGFLTAYEVMTQNFDATELVVLSACETGLGALNPGEGVYGLQRAIQVAGADNIIMSLWRVDDEATKMLMTHFYRYFTEDDDIRAAFIKAQKDIRSAYPDPYFWGAFILAGR